MLPDASVCFDSMSGKKCAAGVSVVVAILPSSCSFLQLLAHGRQVNNHKGEGANNVLLVTWSGP